MSTNYKIDFEHEDTQYGSDATKGVYYDVTNTNTTLQEYADALTFGRQLSTPSSTAVEALVMYNDFTQNNLTKENREKKEKYDEFDTIYQVENDAIKKLDKRDSIRALNINKIDKSIVKNAKNIKIKKGTKIFIGTDGSDYSLFKSLDHLMSGIVADAKKYALDKIGTFDNLPKNILQALDSTNSKGVAIKDFAHKYFSTNEIFDPKNSDELMALCKKYGLEEVPNLSGGKYITATISEQMFTSRLNKINKLLSSGKIGKNSKEHEEIAYIQEQLKEYSNRYKTASKEVKEAVEEYSKMYDDVKVKMKQVPSFAKEGLKNKFTKGVTFGDLIYSKTFEYSKYHPYSIQLIKSDDIGNIVYGAVLHSIKVNIGTALAGAGGYQALDAFSKGKYIESMERSLTTTTEIGLGRLLESSKKMDEINKFFETISFGYYSKEKLSKFLETATYGDDPKDSKAIKFGFNNF